MSMIVFEEFPGYVPGYILVGAPRFCVARESGTESVHRICFSAHSAQALVDAAIEKEGMNKTYSECKKEPVLRLFRCYKQLMLAAQAKDQL